MQVAAAALNRMEKPRKATLPEAVRVALSETCVAPAISTRMACRKAPLESRVVPLVALMSVLQAHSPTTMSLVVLEIDMLMFVTAPAVPETTVPKQFAAFCP